MVTRVKICGITRHEDVSLAVAAGADALGFNMFAASPRYVEPAQARALCLAVPVFVSRVGLFVNHSRDQVLAICDQVPLDLLQFHGDESNDFCASFQRPFIKALRVAPGDDIAARVAAYPDSHGILLDAYVDGLYGGTGRTIEAGQLQALQSLGRAVVLAGGLNPDNVAAAMALARPQGVDVSGGVEAAKGIKDPGMLRRFMQAVRAADADRDPG